MADQLGSDQKQLEANLALLQLDGVDVDVLRNMIVGTPSREGELGVVEDHAPGDFSGMSFISNGSEIAVTGGKADVSGISGEISLQGYQYGDAIPDTGLDYLWWGPSIESISTYPDEEGDSDMSEVNSPSLGSLNGRQAASYNATDADAHKVGQSLPLGSSNEWTAVIVYEIDPDGGDQTVFSMGSDDGSFGGYEIEVELNGSYKANHTGEGSVSGGSPSTDPEIAVATYDGSTAVMDVNGDEVLSGSLSSMSTPQEETHIAQRRDGENNYYGTVAAAGHEAAAADAARRDELTNIMADEFDITVST